MKIGSQVKIAIDGTCVSHSRLDAKARSHRLTVDEPEIRGGTDLAMSPLETFFSSYAACLNVVSNVIIEDLGIDVAVQKIDVNAVFETASFTGKERLEHPFSTIKVTIHARTRCTEDELADLKSQLAWRCPISSVLIAAGLPVSEEWQVTPM